MAKEKVKSRGAGRKAASSWRDDTIYDVADIDRLTDRYNISEYEFLGDAAKDFLDEDYFGLYLSRQAIQKEKVAQFQAVRAAEEAVTRDEKAQVQKGVAGVAGGTGGILDALREQSAREAFKDIEEILRVGRDEAQNINKAYMVERENIRRSEEQRDADAANQGWSDLFSTTASLAGAGAAVGSVVPGLGTAVGGVVGGVIGLGGEVWQNFASGQWGGSGEKDARIDRVVTASDATGEDYL